MQSLLYHIATSITPTPIEFLLFQEQGTEISEPTCILLCIACLPSILLSSVKLGIECCLSSSLSIEFCCLFSEKGTFLNIRNLTLCYSFNLECPPNAHVLKLGIQIVTLLGGGGNFEVSRSGI